MSIENENIRENENMETAPSVKRTRRFMLIGVGDGGCNIADTIHTAIPDSYFIAYNTSMRATDKRHPNVKIVPYDEDGTGKDRTYSQNVFRQGSYRDLLRLVNEVQALPKTACDYVMVIATCDGGTGGGVSPMMTKYLKDNIEIPVLLMGVYPNLQEDATAQYNAMQWQGEVEKHELAYLVLDNNSALTRMEYQAQVNKQAADIMKLLSGQMFGETDLAQIDNRDMYTLLTHFPGRITVHFGTTKPAVNSSIGSYLLNLFPLWNEPAPTNARGYGLFIKAPEAVLKAADTTIEEVRNEVGDVVVQYTHLEPSDNDVAIALICVGCTEASDRIGSIWARYDEIRFNMRDNAKGAVTRYLDDMVSPMAAASAPVRKDPASEPDLSALGL